MRVSTALTRSCSSWHVECLRLAGTSKDNLLVIFSLFGLLVVDPSILIVGEKMECPGFLLRGWRPPSFLALLFPLSSFGALSVTRSAFLASVTAVGFAELVFFGLNQVRTGLSGLKSSIWLRGKEAISSCNASVAVASPPDIFFTACQIRASISRINFGLSFPNSFDV